MNREGHMAAASGDRGFTLLELLVSLMLLGLVSVLLVEAFRQTAGVWRAADEAADHTEAVVFVEEFLRARLEAPALCSVPEDPGNRVYPFEGEMRELTFSSTA